MLTIQEIKYICNIFIKQNKDGSLETFENLTHLMNCLQNLQVQKLNQKDESVVIGLTSDDAGKDFYTQCPSEKPE